VHILKKKKQKQKQKTVVLGWVGNQGLGIKG